MDAILGKHDLQRIHVIDVVWSKPKPKTATSITRLTEGLTLKLGRAVGFQFRTRVDGACLWHAVLYRVPKTGLSLLELDEGADRARRETCHHDTYRITPLYMRAMQGSLLGTQVNQQCSSLLHIPIGFSAGIYHAGYSGNQYNIVIDGLLVVRQVYCFSALHPYTKKFNGLHHSSSPTSTQKYSSRFQMCVRP